MPVPYRMSFNGKLDRLSSLIDRLRVHVTNASVGGAEPEFANFWICEEGGGAVRLAFCPIIDDNVDCSSLGVRHGERLLVAAHITISGVGKQLFTALPGCLSVPLAEEPYLTAIVTPLIEEVATPRCGGQAVFQRLCEVVVIRLLRHALEQGNAHAGMLRGLAHPLISAALVAMHESPEEPWTLEKLAETAAMSRTQFAVTFKEEVGATPMGYLANWRFDIARSELETGEPVKRVARNCGFSSAAAFSRAYSKRYGHPPKLEKAGVY